MELELAACPASDRGGPVCVYHALPGAEATNYGVLQADILTHCGLSVKCAAATFHRWSYRCKRKSLNQIDDLVHATNWWLQTDQLTSREMIQCLIIDCVVQDLLPKEKHVVGMAAPQNLHNLVKALKTTTSMLQMGQARPGQAGDTGAAWNPQWA